MSQAEALAGRLNDRLLVSLDNNIGEMNDRWGDAERILKTRMPFGYDANDLPMDGIGATITRNVSDALDIDSSELLPPPEPVLNGVYR